MASPTQWTWVWANFRRWWRTGKPGVLQSMGSPRVRHNWDTEQKKACQSRACLPVGCSPTASLVWVPCSCADTSPDSPSYASILWCVDLQPHSANRWGGPDLHCVSELALNNPHVFPVWSSFPGASDGKESACSVGDLSIPGLGRSPEEGNGNSL